METDMKIKLASLKKRKAELNTALSKNADFSERVEVNKQIKELVDFLTGAKEDIKMPVVVHMPAVEPVVTKKVVKKAKQPIPPPTVA
jgi:hypothetical protein